MRHPIWPGFAINTVFYAVVLWLLFAGPFALRRWRRIRRGLCPKCAYDLRGSASETCPECGSAVTSSRSLTGGHGGEGRIERNRVDLWRDRVRAWA